MTLTIPHWFDGARFTGTSDRRVDVTNPVTHVSDRQTREPLAPYGGSSPAMATILAAHQRRRPLPFANFHRLHVVPPLTTTAEEARGGVRTLDEALTEARAPVHATGERS